MRLAFKKTARPTVFGPIAHAIGKTMDASIYSHVELVFRTGSSGSSCYGEGVRFKDIQFVEGAWDFYTLPDELEPVAHRWYSTHLGEGYDNLGVLRFGCSFLRESPSKWFCTEAHAAALGWSEPWRYGPGGFLARCKDHLGSVQCDSPYDSAYKIHPAVSQLILTK